MSAVDPHAYHFDLRDKVEQVAGRGDAAVAEVRRLTGLRNAANPVDIVQFALGALQTRDPALLDAVAAVVAWLETAMQEDGALVYAFPMPHTFPLEAPWTSALAQGEAASLLVRAAIVLDRPELVETAERALAPLLDRTSRLVVDTEDGPVLQEYPTSPPSHVLNGWITALWGLYDFGVAFAPSAGTSSGERARGEFEAGVDALARRVRLYRTFPHWSRYDLFPHPMPNVASLKYHLLHVGHLRTLNGLAPRDAFVSAADEWERSANDVRSRALAFARKAAFRTVRPRSRRIGVRS